MVATVVGGVVRGAARAPFDHGLFSVVPFPPSTADRWETGVDWEAVPCAAASGTGAPCVPSVIAPSTGSLVGSASPFTVYADFACSPVAHSPDTARSMASDRLEAREEARVEQALWTGDLGNEPSFAGAEVLSPGASVGPLLAVALLEQHLSDEYGSRGIIHVSRSTAVLLYAADAVVLDRGRLTTVLGTPVVAGAGYPAAAPGAAGAAGTWAVCTPAMFGYRSEVFAASSRSGDTFDKGVNVLIGLAERSYLIGWDPCGVAAVQIDPAK